MSDERGRDECQFEPEDEGRLDPDDKLVLIPDGLYQARFLGHETRRSSGRFGPKVYMYFEITAPEEFAGEVLVKYYNVKRISGSARRGGGFTPSSKGDLCRDFARLIDEPGRLDRIPLSRFRDKEWIIKVVSVLQDSKGRLLTSAVRYSKVDDIVGSSPRPGSRSRQTSSDPDPSPDPAFLVLDEGLF
jgi:hypothetical protein